MKVIGEVMVIGCMFEELILKVVCLFELNVYYLELKDVYEFDDVIIEKCICKVGDEWLFYIVEVICCGVII